MKRLGLEVLGATQQTGAALRPWLSLLLLVPSFPCASFSTGTNESLKLSYFYAPFLH